MEEDRGGIQGSDNSVICEDWTRGPVWGSGSEAASAGNGARIPAFTGMRLQD